MWGGNIPSTLAGEFSFSLGLALAVLFFGLLRALQQELVLLLRQDVTALSGLRVVVVSCSGVV